MSKKMRISALVLAALMMVSVFAGCGKKEKAGGSSAVVTESEVALNDSGIANAGSDVASNEGEGDGDNDTSSNTKSTATKSRTGTKVDINKTGWPIVNEKITINIMGFSLPGYSDPKSMSFFKYYEKLTNVAVKFTGVAENKIGERKALAMQSGDLPDVFAVYNNTFTDYEINKYASEGAFVDLSKDIKTYAPNMQKCLDKYPVIKAINTAQNGKIYTMPVDMPTSDNYDHWLNINKKWLDDLGLSIPKTTTEFLNVMRAFRDQDPNGNGQKDEVPFATWNWGPSLITGFWGVSADDKNVGIDNNGTAYAYYATPNTKAACEWWHNFYVETGLMNTTIPGKSDGFWKTFKDHIATGKVGCFNWSYLQGGSFDPQILKQYVAIPYPTANFANASLNLPKARQPYGNAPKRGGKIVTKKCKNVAAVLRYYDYLYTPEGRMLGTYGSPDAGLYTKEKDGSYTINVVKNKSTATESLGWTMGIPEAKNGTDLKINTENVKINEEYYKYSKAAVATYKKANKEDPSKYIPEIFKTSDEIVKLRKFETFVGSGALSNYVTGGRKLADWTTWQNEMSQKGLAQYVKLWQGIFDRNKEFMGSTAQ